jgi:hypothetical protein
MLDTPIQFRTAHWSPEAAENELVTNIAKPTSQHLRLWHCLKCEDRWASIKNS